MDQVCGIAKKPADESVSLRSGTSRKPVGLVSSRAGMLNKDGKVG